MFPDFTDDDDLGNDFNDFFQLGLGGGPGVRDPTASELLDDEDQNYHSLLQQPLAVGFYVSSAPTGPLPAWFWSSCPQRENLCPVCFRVCLAVLFIQTRQFISVCVYALKFSSYDGLHALCVVTFR